MQPARNIDRGAINLDQDFDPLNYPGIKLDNQGMILPHCILGSLEDFRSYCEAIGETELVKRIPVPQKYTTSESQGSPSTKTGNQEVSSCWRSIQSNALQNWQTHMRQRRQHENFLADLLDRPVENLLMNQANHSRETQEQREVLKQVIPPIHSRYGHRGGSEFWNLPPHYGDEMSGITATLTRTEQGRKAPLTHVGQPRSIQQESELMGGKTVCQASQTRADQSAHLQHQRQELREVPQGLDLKKPDISGLQVVGSCKPCIHVTVTQSPSVEKDEQEKEQKKIKRNPDPLGQDDDVHSDALRGPALRFCGQLARWTGNSEDRQGEVAIDVNMLFEAQTGEIASSHLKLYNEGSTAIFYSWEKLCFPSHFPNLIKKMHSYFYFNSSSGVILPGETKVVECFFKSVRPGLQEEAWRLKTHPLLLSGASMQVLLTAFSLDKDVNRDQRLFNEAQLEKTVTVKMCQTIVDEILEGVHTPERPSSPAEFYVTEEQQFLSKNPKLQFLEETVEDLKNLWHEVNPGHEWDLSVDTLRQAVLAQPDQESAMEKNLAKLNSLYLELSGPPVQKHKYPTVAAAGRHLWRKLLDAMDDDAQRIRNILDDAQRDKQSRKKEESLTLEDVADKDEISEKKKGAAAREEKTKPKSRRKGDNKRESRPAVTDKQAEDSKRKGEKRDEVEKRSMGKQGEELPSLTDTQTEDIMQQTPEAEGPDVREIYTRLLHQKVYARIGDLVNTLCATVDELSDQDHKE